MKVLVDHLTPRPCNCPCHDGPNYIATCSECDGSLKARLEWELVRRRICDWQRGPNPVDVSRAVIDVLSHYGVEVAWEHEPDRCPIWEAHRQQAAEASNDAR